MDQTTVANYLPCKNCHSKKTTKGGIPFTTSSGNGTENPDHATNPDNPENLDKFFGMMGWLGRSHAKPFEPTTDNALDQMGNMVELKGDGEEKENGKSNSTYIPGSVNKTFEPNQKIDVALINTGSIYVGTSDDTSAHQERTSHHTLIISNNLGKINIVITPNNQGGTDTIHR